MFDYKDIQKDFDKVLCYSQNQTEVNTDSLFEKWFKAKERFIEKMGNQLIYESPYDVAITLPKEAREQRINNYIEIVRRISGEIGEFLETEKMVCLTRKYVLKPVFAIILSHSVLKLVKHFIIFLMYIVVQKNLNGLFKNCHV